MDTQTPQPPPLMSVQQVAQHLQCSRQTVYKLIDEGHLKATNIAQGSDRTKLRITPDHLADFIKAGQDHAPGEDLRTIVP